MAWGKFYTFRATGSSQKNIPGRTTLYSPGAIFGFGITCSSQLSTKSWDGLLRNDGEKDN